jgi:hypothetical protein
MVADMPLPEAVTFPFMTDAPLRSLRKKTLMKVLFSDRESDDGLHPVPEIAVPNYGLGNFAAAVCAAILLYASSVRAEPVALEELAAFPSQQVTGVTVAAKGRVFVNFPFWSDDHTVSVAEVVEGKLKPFPDDAWNAKDGPPAQRWICVQSVVVDDQDALWVLDPASPKTEAVVKGGPKLVKIDLATNKVTQTITLGEDVAPERSYLNDVRLDTKTGNAFITESGTGAILVVDLKSGKARRLLANDLSTKLEPEDLISVIPKPR